MGGTSFWLKVLLFWPFVTYAKEHQRCLRNIDRLERDLFPEWFPKLVSLSGPGSILQIPQSNYEQIFGNFYGATQSPVTDALRNPKSQWHPVGAAK